MSHLYEEDDACPCGEHEPQFGLPEHLPEDERILWQGQPTADFIRKLTKGWVRSLAAISAVIFLLQVLAAAGLTYTEIARNTLVLSMPFWILATAIHYIARSAAHATVYTITDKRVTFRTGFIMRTSTNIPFQAIAKVGVSRNADDSYDMPIGTRKGEQIAYAMLWPNLQWTSPIKAVPAMRAIAQNEPAADILATALARFHKQPVLPVADRVVPGTADDRPVATDHLPQAG